MRNIITNTETLAAVKARQVIWTTADAQATAGLTDSDMVITYTEITPFGRYLVAIEPAQAGTAQ
jgi:hypothetical protein